MIARLLKGSDRKGNLAMHARLLAMVGALFLAAGCVTNEDGSTANIFGDLETIMSGNDVSEQQGALRDQADSYNDYAEARIASAVAGAIIGGIIGYAAGDEEGALLGAAAGGVAGYVGGSYLTRDHSEFQASRESLDEDIAIAEELTGESRKNIALAQAALNWQKLDVDRLNREYAAGLVESQEYENALMEIEKDRGSVRSMIDTTRERIATLDRSISKYRSAGYDTSRLDAAKSAQRQHIVRLEAIEDAMVTLIAGAPDGVERPSV